MSHESLLRCEQTLLVVVDIQEKLLPVIDAHENVSARSRILVEAAGMLDIPVFVTEQYPKGLGPTVAALRPLLRRARFFQKTCFSCCGDDAFLDAVEECGREQVLLCGIETHVCVQQTALDLIDQGLQVHVAADAVGSRAAANRLFALERMRGEGVVINCSESACFEWLKVAGTDTFKAVSKLLR